MRLIVEIIAALLLVVCVTVTSAAFAAGKIGRSADGLSCGISAPAKRLARRALRRDAAPMRRKILGELLQRQDAVGGELKFAVVIPAPLSSWRKPGPITPTDR